VWVMLGGGVRLEGLGEVRGWGTVRGIGYS